MNPPNSKTYEIIVGPKIKVTVDTRSKTRVINFPFEFPDGTKGVAIICRVKDEEWVPNTEIKSIKLTFS
jgi:hypothetical protein